MATLGLTRLRAINRILRGSGEDTVTAVPSASDVTASKDAEDVLDEVTDLVLKAGWPENTEKGKAYTPAGAGPAAGSGSGTGTSVADDNASWTASSKTITAASGTFTNYTFGSGDLIYVYPVGATAATTLVEGYHPIASKPGATSVTLDSQPFDTDQTVGIREVGPLKVTLGSDILMIRSSYGSPNGHRTFVLNNDDVLYDADLKSETLANDDAIYLDVSREYTFEKLSPSLKEHIVAWARLEYQRWKKGLEDRDTFLLQELAVAETMQPRNPFEQGTQVQPLNPISAFLQASRSQSPRQTNSQRQ